MRTLHGWKITTVLIMGTVIGSILVTHQKQKTVVMAWTYLTPYSTDPLEYDAAEHHFAFRGVYSSLVTQYPSSGLEGDIASSWYASPDKKTWNFTIANGQTFSDGSPLNAAVIKRSLTRAAFLLKLKGSNSGLLEHLQGFDRMTSIQEIEGIRVQQNDGLGHLLMDFSKPMPRLPELISFGMYAIVSPADYDHLDGHWLNPKAIRASGPLQVLSFDNDSIQLKRWRQFGAEEVDRFTVSWNPEAKENAQLILGNSMTDVATNQAAATGPLSDIIYVHCQSWNRPGSGCSNIEARRWLREQFYGKLKNEGVPLPNSFFPPSLMSASFRELRTKPVREPEGSLRLNIRLNKSPTTLTPIVNQAFRQLLENSHFHGDFTDPSSEEQHRELDPNLEAYQTDITGRFTGVLLEYPSDDIRFMFESKEGIRLPDPTGKIRKLLKNEPLDIDAIDRQIWDDAIVWPIGHSASSVIYTRDLLDLSPINLVEPPTDLSRIRFKK